MTQATVHATAPTGTVTTWQMWVPCVGMALCSWLSFVDRQVLNILAPTIIKDTGLTNADFTNCDVVFFPNLRSGNPVWDRCSIASACTGMLLAVGVWTIASMSHAGWPASRVCARPRVLGLEGGTFPGGLRTAVETLPANLRARGIALSFSGGTIGAVMMPLLLGPLAIDAAGKPRSWPLARRAIWLLIWAAIARPPFLPKSSHMTSKLAWPNLRERRVWALMFSYALPAISPGPVLTILSLYLAQRLQLTQADVNNVVWIPPLTWGIGYFFWGWAADRYAANNPGLSACSRSSP